MLIGGPKKSRLRYVLLCPYRHRLCRIAHTCLDRHFCIKFGPEIISSNENRGIEKIESIRVFSIIVQKYVKRILFILVGDV